jgi:hypothetical protein
MTRPKNAPIGSRVLPVLLAAVCIAAPLAAAPSPEGEGPELSAPEAAPAEVGASGMRIAVDPKTGEVVSNQARESRVLSEALAHALNRSTEGLKIFSLPAGGMGVHLEGRFQHVMTVKVKADGSLELGCVDNATKAEEILHGKVAGPDDEPSDR